MPAVDKKGAEDTPLLKQYRALKAAHPHAILFFRLGDFYELFDEDAKAAAPVLGVVLTQRQGLPMCGVPHHSHANYLAKLLRHGFKVAIADQVSDPAAAKGLVRREVTRVVTPGTVVEEELLDARSANYLAAVELDSVGWGLAVVEVSTGEFWAEQALSDHGREQLKALLSRLRPAEVLAPARAEAELHLKALLGPRTSVSDWSRTASESVVPPHWDGKSTWKNRPLALKAALTARSYVAATQAHLRELPAPTLRESQDALQLDDSAIRTLELVDSEEGGRKHTLWGVLDHTATPMGSRRLRRWILHPSTKLPEIERRANAVSELVEKPLERSRLRQILEGLSDLERVINRMATRSAGPRDLAALRGALSCRGPLEDWLAGGEVSSAAVSGLAADLGDAAPALKELHALLARALADEPPARISDGGLIRPGHDAALDELRRVRTDGTSMLKELEERERKASGLALKVGYNSVFGYYLELSKANSAKAPARWTRKQTLTNAERYITPELKELESRLLGAEDRFLKRELALFEALRASVLEADAAVRRFASLTSELDALQSLAEAAARNDYAKPVVDLSNELEIVDGRHPIVEAALPAGSFVPNSCTLDGAENQTIVLTGPNMGGKSVYLRQTALIALMAQMGGFVPAKSARVGIVDRILTRIGSRDQLARGESTFMVEMRETSHILRSATKRSLVLLDEVGRGTSTYDGISIAWAVVEHLNRLGGADGVRGPRVLFATHYFELTELAVLLSGVKNANVEAREWTNAEGRTEVVFLHKISPGPADRSFGIHVAELAGLPAPCLARAREILHGLENEARSAPPPVPAALDPQPSLPIFEEHPAIHALRLLDPEDLTPLEALAKLAELKKKL
ncbi:MAG: DNA mismatch repair protein MutS [Elusimicrobia bacterium]|nr:DNA mismatch repair protein MutS [Elusimicrobiota bacterium]